MVDQLQSVPDSGGLWRIFIKEDFNSDRFVKNAYANGGDYSDELLKSLSRMSKEASEKMKKTIFANYRQFIEAGKTARNLESAMHQLNNLFTEKERLVQSLARKSLLDSNHISDPSASMVQREQNAEAKLSEYSGRSVTDLAEVIQGISRISGDFTRKVIFDGVMRELHPETQTLMSVIHLFLFTDCIVVAHKPSKIGFDDMHKFRYQSMHELAGVTMVNIPYRDRRRSAINAFKLIFFSSNTRIFQADSLQEKQQWMQLLEGAIHASLAKSRGLVEPNDSTTLTNNNKSDAGQQQVSSSDTSSWFSLPVEAVSRSDVSSTSLVHSSLDAIALILPDTESLLISAPVNEDEDRMGRLPNNLLPSRQNPFDQSSPSRLSRSSSGHQLNNNTNTDSPLNLWTLPEDLDVAISERHFSQATALLLKAREQLDAILASSSLSGSVTGDDAGSGTSQEASSSGNLDAVIQGKPRQAWDRLGDRLHRIEQSLTEVLEGELLTAANRRADRRTIGQTVGYLIALGKGAWASQLLLVHRSNLMAQNLSQGGFRQEGNQLAYLTSLSMTFHRNLAESFVDWRDLVRGQVGDNGDDEESLTSQLLSIRFSSWVIEETIKFSHQVRVFLFDSRSLSLHAMVQVAERIRAHADLVSQLINVDITSTLFDNLIDSWKEVIKEQSRILVDAVSHHRKNTNWLPISEMAPSEAEAHMNQLRQIGLITSSSESQVLPLTGSTCQLVRSIWHLVQSSSRLNQPNLYPAFGHCLALFLRTLLQLYQSTLSGDLSEQVESTVRANLAFLYDVALPRLLATMDLIRYGEIREVVACFKILLGR